HCVCVAHYGSGEGVRRRGAANSLVHSGTISGAQFGVLAATGTTDSTIENQGSITGSHTCVSATAATGSTNLTSSGLMDCGATAVQLGSGDDLVALVDGSATIGDIDLADGTDSVVLDVGDGLAGRRDGSILAAEALHKDGAGLFTINGDAEAGFSSAHVNAGTLQLADGILTGNTHVAAGATLRA